MQTTVGRRIHLFHANNNAENEKQRTVSLIWLFPQVYQYPKDFKSSFSLPSYSVQSTIVVQYGSTINDPDQIMQFVAIVDLNRVTPANACKRKKAGKAR